MLVRISNSLLRNKFAYYCCQPVLKTPKCRIGGSSMKTIFQAYRYIVGSCYQLGVHVRPYGITSRLEADQFIRDLDVDELQRLNKALADFHEEQELENVNQQEPLPFKILLTIAITNSVPFIGFGFLDNAIMIFAGDYIDDKLGAVLGISTMAAAALGNMISDVAGIGLAGYVEALASRLGIEEPKMTSAQSTMRETRIASYIGRGIGIVIGCIVGMFPLMFISKKNEETREDEKKG